MARVWALGSSARLALYRLSRGRTHVRLGTVSNLGLVPGEVRADLQGSTPSRYRVRLRVRQVFQEAWLQVAKTLTARAADAAALLLGAIPGGWRPTPGPSRSRCCQELASSGLSAPARTGPPQASPRRRSAIWCPTFWMPTPSSSTP
ncbi:MAG: hypothetical protein ACYCYK_11060 [Candidatus Dormibacteria bacterium]